MDVILYELGLTYQQTMVVVPIALRELLQAKALRKKNGNTRLRRVHKRHYTHVKKAFFRLGLCQLEIYLLNNILGYCFVGLIYTTLSITVKVCLLLPLQFFQHTNYVQFG